LNRHGLNQAKRARFNPVVLANSSLFSQKTIELGGDAVEVFSGGSKKGADAVYDDARAIRDGGGNGYVAVASRKSNMQILPEPLECGDILDESIVPFLCKLFGVRTLTSLSLFF